MRKTTIETLREELEPYKNTLVLDCFKVVRLVGVYDGEEDFYWQYDDHQKGIYDASCVGGWTPLKGVLPDDEYRRLLSLWNLNNIEKAI